MQTKSFSYVDAHAHINFSEYDIDRDSVILDAESKGIIIINVGTDLESSKQAE